MEEITNEMEEAIYFIKALGRIKNIIETEPELVTEFAKVIELKETGKIHSVVSGISTGATIFAMGMAMRAMFDSNADSLNLAMLGVSASSVFSMGSSMLTINNRFEMDKTKELLKNAIQQVLETDGKVNLEELNIESRNRCKEVLVFELLRDKAFISRVKKLEKINKKTKQDSAQM